MKSNESTGPMDERPSASLRALRGLLSVFGVVAIVMGGLSVILGVRSVAGAGPIDASADSELRFYAAWYVAAGALGLAAARRAELRRPIVYAISGGFFLAASGRLIGLLVVGVPHPVAIVLMVIEFVLPAAFLPLLAAASRDRVRPRA